jgi:predicted DNA-binding transcriptional regulator AlpA
MTTEQPVYLRTHQILKLLGIGRTAWHNWVKRGLAPAGIRLSPRVFVWKKDDIDAFLKTSPKVGAAE